LRAIAPGISSMASRPGGFFPASVKPRAYGGAAGTLAAFISLEGNARKVLETTSRHPSAQWIDASPAQGSTCPKPKPQPDLTAAIDKKKKTITTKKLRRFS
jgi:hypothetical protein